jgi:predicted MFS family arabinose efflux permease
VTYTAYLALAGWAWFLYGFGAMLTLLVDEQGISRTVGGLHLTAQALGGLVSGLLVAPVVRRVRRRGALILGAALIVTGIALLLVGAPTALTLCAALVLGTGGSLSIIAINPVLIQHHGAAGAAVISEANAVAAGVGLIAPLAVGAGIRAGLGWRPALLVTAAVMTVVAWRVRGLPRPTASLDAGLPPRGSDAGRLPAAIWPLMAVIVLCVGVEFSMTTWTAELLRREIGMADSAATAGVSAIVAGMALGRLLLSRLALRWHPRHLLFAAIGVALCGWGLLWAASSPGPAVAGLILAGLGIGGHFPLGLSLMLAHAHGQQDKASGALSIGVSAGIGLAPFALGALADATSVHTAFLVVPCLLVAAAGILAAVP